MATKWKAKGCSVLVSISSVYTAIPSITDFSVDGEQSETFEVKTIDLSQYVENPSSGFTRAPTLTVNTFWDPTNAVHIVLDGLPASPAATNVKTTYSDSGPKSYIYSVTGLTKSVNVTAGDGIKATYTMVTSGAPT